MTEQKQFKLPDVGEGLTEADILKWHVQPGDPVQVNQTIVEIETAKAVVELPCPYEGVVASLLVAEGQTVDVGTPIITVDVAGAAGGPAAAVAAPAPAAAADGGQRAASGAEAAGQGGDGPAPRQERQPVLVGYGVKLGSAKRRPRKAGGPAVAAGPAATQDRPVQLGAAAPLAAAGPAAGARQPGPAAPPVAPAPATAGRIAVLAKPPVRKLARELGVDLASVTGTGPNGSITRADVQGWAATAAAPAPVTWRPAGAGLREERIPVRGVRKHTAAAVAASAFTAPHVTEFLQLDVTATMEATHRIRELPEFADLPVSPLLLVARALLLAAARYPMINSSWDGGAEEIVVKHYVNLGIAVATPRGLIVPNIKDAHTLPMAALAGALAGLADTARAGKATPADLTGGTITITNVGIFGVDTGTPILTPGEAAILALGQIRDMPWVHDGELAIRKVCTLSLSFDHRIIDGDLGSAALRDIGAMLGDPLRMLAWA